MPDEHSFPGAFHNRPLTPRGERATPLPWEPTTPDEPPPAAANLPGNIKENIEENAAANIQANVVTDVDVPPTQRDAEAELGPLGRRLVDLAGAMRLHGVVVGTSDVVDAGQVACVLGLGNRERLREGLAAALVRRGEQRGVFDDLFDIFFPAALGRRSAADGVALAGLLAQLPDFDADTADAAELRERARALTQILAKALAENDEQALETLAGVVVDEFGRLRRAGDEGFSANQAIEQFQPNLAIARAAEILREHDEYLRRLRAEQEADALEGSGGSPGLADEGVGSSDGGTGSGGQAATDPAGWQPDPFVRRFDRDEIRSRVAGFRRRIESESRRRNAETRGRASQATYAVTTPIERRDFSQTYAIDAAQMRRVVEPLARKLAARMAAKRRRASHGRIDIRKTLRASMSTGGVPIAPVYDHRTPNRSELVILADMSSSVSGFSRFTILLMQAMQAQFARVRVFGFVNTVDELTETVRSVGADGDLIEALRGNTRMQRGHRNSDYGMTFVDFVAHHLDAVTPRATLLVLGDARTNSTNPRYDALRTIVDEARHAFWLNPEAESQWGTGDSVATKYAEIIDMHECRTITDLRDFITRAL